MQKQIAKDVKGLALAEVQGTYAEKIAYWAVIITAAVMFMVTFVNTCSAAASGTITSAITEEQTVLRYPVMWFCFESSQIFVDAQVIVDDQSDCVNAKAGQTNRYVVEYKAIRSGDSLKLEKTCLGDLAEAATDAFVERLEKEINGLGILSTAVKCFGINTAGTMNKSSSELGPVQLDYTMTPKSDSVAHKVMVGLADPSWDRNPTTETFLRGAPILVNGYNQEVNLLVHVDYIADIRDQFHWGVRKLDDVDAQHISSQYVLNPVSTDYRMNAGISAADATYMEASKTKIKFDFETFTTTTLLQRRKAGSEVWAEIGGAWGTSVLLIGLFFVEKMVAGRATRVFRYRTSASKKELIVQFAKDLKEAHAEGATEMVMDIAKPDDV